MMRKLLFCLLTLCCVNNTFSQNGTTFQVEELSKTERLLSTISDKDIYKRLILSDKNLSLFHLKKDNIDYPFNIIAQSEATDSLVNMGYNSFFNGMYQAYADHRPFVLSPDMIWLLISQGFAQHVNANPEAMRPYFVDSFGKQTLVVQAKEEKTLEDPTFSWEKIFPEFTKQIKENTKNDLAELLTCDFSTTTPLEKIASEITIMEAMKPYFEFVVINIVCGIPEITLEGTPEDWEKVLSKARRLKEYNLDWWISGLEPLLEEFVKASKGEANKDFWRNMFKYHLPKGCGDPEIIDGWIIKFFPYDNKGKRNNLQQLVGSDKLPNEIVKVDIKYLEIYKNSTREVPLEFWAGFIGLKQNKETFALRPQIGWMIKKKNPKDSEIEHDKLLNKLQGLAQEDQGLDGGIHLSIKKVPPVLFELKEIKKLNLNFIDDINIPEELSKVNIKEFILSGKISVEGIKRIKKLFPNTKLTINGDRW